MANSNITIRLLENPTDGHFFRMEVLPEGNISKWLATTFRATSSEYYDCQIGATLDDTINNWVTQLTDYWIGRGEPQQNYTVTKVDSSTLTIETIYPNLTLDPYFFSGLENKVEWTRSFFNQVDTTPTEPYIRISESNPIALALVKDYNGFDTKQNIFNSKSIQANNSVVYGVAEEIDRNHEVKTQLWSNYETITATQTDEDGLIESLGIQLKTQNLNVTDKRDALLATPSDLDSQELVGVYFESGNTYEYGFGSTTISGTYTLNGGVPEWGVIGNSIYIDAYDEWGTITDVVYSQSLAASVLITDITYNSSNTGAVQVSSKYNRLNYNVYEFVLKPYYKVDKYMNIQLGFSSLNTGFNDVNYSSEDLFIIDGVENEDKKIEVVWFDYENTSDIYFNNGFYGVLNLPYVSFAEGIENEIETDKKSNTVLMVSADNYHTKKLVLENITSNMKRKLTEVFSHREVFLDRIRYSVKSISTEWVPDTNTYTFEVDMYYAENGFNPNQDRELCGDRYLTTYLQRIYNGYSERCSSVIDELCVKGMIQQLLDDNRYESGTVLALPRGGGISDGVLHTLLPNTSAGDFTYSGTNQTRIDINGNMVVVDDNTPPISYEYGVDECPVLKLEGEDTNKVIYSEDFSQSYWNGGGCTRVGGFASPDGFNNAYQIIKNTNTFINGSAITLVDGNDYFQSIWLKGSGQVRLKAQEEGGDFTTYDSLVIELTDNWTRYILPFTKGVDGNPMRVVIDQLDDSDTLYVFGAQVSSTDGTYIPTNGSEQTRNKSICQGSQFEDVASGGVWKIQLAAWANDGTNRTLMLRDSISGFDFIQVTYSSTDNTIYVRKRVSLVTSAPFLSYVLTDATDFNDVWLSWQSDMFYLKINGITIGEFSGSLPSSIIIADFYNEGASNNFTGKVGQNTISNNLDDFNTSFKTYEEAASFAKFNMQ